MAPGTLPSSRAFLEETKLFPLGLRIISFLSTPTSLTTDLVLRFWEVAFPLARLLRIIVRSPGRRPLKISPWPKGVMHY